MQPNENYTVTRRALDVEDYIDILRRHKGWIFGPFLFALVVSVVGGYTWPDTFVSKGIIKVEPQQVPESLVPAAMTRDMLDKINSMLESIESHGTLTEIITTYNLYLKERSRQPLEDVIEDMKKKIIIDPLGQNANRQVPAFRISFSYPDKHLAQKVVQDLMGKFMNESTRNQSNTTFQTTEFLKAQADAAQKELEGIEVRLAAYKMENNGRLPEQAANNYAKLQSLETAAGTVTNQISHYEQEKLQLESTLTNYTHQADEIAKIKPDPIPASLQQKSQRLLKAEAEVESLTNNLQVLRQKYQDTYPDVKATQEFLKAAEAKRDAILAEESEAKKEVGTGKPVVTSASAKEALDREATVTRYQNMIAADDTQIEDLRGQLKHVNQDISRLNGQLNAVPQSEKEYDDLRRERDLKKEQYESMANNLHKAQVQQDLEDRKEGETLNILDAASLPETADSPNHPEVIAIGAGIGLMLGIVIAGAREMKDTSLKNLKDVRAYTQMAILGSIPLLENDFVVRRRRRLAWLGWTTACLTAVVLMSGSVVYYISTKGQ